MRIMSYLLMACLVSLLSASVAQSMDAPLPMGEKGTLTIADFDAWEEINNLGGLFGPWTRDPDDTTASCRLEITDDDKWGEQGLSLRLIYDVESPMIAYNGMWMFLQEIDFTPYKYLVIHVRGDREAGFTPRFKIELKNKSKEVGRFVITGVTDQWQQIAIPMDRIKGIQNFKAMKEMVVTFDDMRCSPKIGEIYIDNIYLSK
ncbi:MAG: hypothetical protein JXB04_03670 [Kiritimatiellae bacterium]|nr:hypothetical protein [Kiritimatiellia bacterium]